MTFDVTASISGRAVSPAWARRVKTASGGADRAFGRPLRGAGLLVLLIMTTIGSQLIFVPAAFAQDFAPISGSGSTGSFNVIAKATRTYQRHVRARLRCDSFVARATETASSTPVQVINR